MDRYQKKIIDYYQDCHYQFKSTWHLEACLSMNYGYWDSTTKNLQDALLRMNDIVMSEANIQASDRVLDAGCGVGGTLIHLAKSRGIRGSGITLVAKQVRQAKEYAKKHGVGDKVQFLQGDFSNTGLPNASFDVVLAIESAGYARDKYAFLKEMRRILRPGGRFVLADFFKTKEDLGTEGEKVVNSLLSGWAAISYTSSNEYRKIMAAAGFKKISCRDITKNIVPSSNILYRAFFLGVVAAKIGQTIGIRNEVQVGNVWSCYHQYKAIKNNYIDYKLIVGKF